MAASYRQGRVSGDGLSHRQQARGRSVRSRRHPKRSARLSVRQRHFPVRSQLATEQLDPPCQRPDLPAPLRHQLRRPAALDGQSRTDRRQLLFLGRRLVHADSAPFRRAGPGSDRPARNRLSQAICPIGAGRDHPDTGEHLGGVPPRWTGHAARLRQRAVGSAPDHSARPGGAAYRAGPRRSL